MDSTPSLKERYAKDGFVIIPGLIPAEDRTELEAACERVIAKTRAGLWTHRRVVGKQFPPYDTETNPDSWGVQHVMHPDLHEPAFAKWYTSDPLVHAAAELLECEEGDLQMELFNLLINPLSHEFALRWHRDDVKETASEEEERAALSVWDHGVQWNTALYQDSCLYVVPGSHKLPRTPEQRAQSATQSPPDDPSEMPGAVQVVLQPGETVFYNNNILHCGTYKSHERRATLHACMGDTRGGSTRARNILQHGLRWMKEDAFRATLNPRGNAMLERLLAMERSVGGHVGYSLD
ncbi:hypothetical protein PUNSTDRAFT_146419 [Punctularia strigosozonata HHB-11173 SS5]|uniref:Phytanoyl-CoA dioxygenase n=1 Tax=Punctularia strigosozonata (strain HHB-11173) TaxID=741275 RepID=R7S1Z6_PUNST|nr:uncharacterized protein PUNSTDRAFT_146419 [Punctularia strigosozonata HHB-11173 SS5]EIN04435.1 hypothetical protein PUNSTDRAFT_146419 [Punctularia strigosozonata HHB-11173 SS5]